jgi:tRNA threonylcarbamoyl adenosine modification protein YeaZ
VSVLAIDTTSRDHLLVLLTTAAGEVLDSRELDGRLDRTLPAAVAALLDDAVEAVVVLTGPGSYTGVRAGMAAALALATTRAIPLHGIGTLMAVAVAAEVADGAFVAVADAGRGGVYAGDFVRGGGTTVDAGEPLRRVTIDSLASLRSPVAGTSDFPGVDVHVVNRATALALAVPAARSRPALEAAGLTAVLVRAAPGQEGA